MVNAFPPATRPKFVLGYDPKNVLAAAGKNIDLLAHQGGRSHLDWSNFTRPKTLHSKKGDVLHHF